MVFTEHAAMIDSIDDTYVLGKMSELRHTPLVTPPYNPITIPPSPPTHIYVESEWNQFCPNFFVVYSLTTREGHQMKEPEREPESKSHSISITTCRFLWQLR